MDSMKRRLGALLLFGTALASGPALAEDIPPLDKATEATGRPLTADQSAVKFEQADLTFEIFPETKSIRGTAILGFSVQSAIDSIQVDLDPRYEITAIEVDGGPISADRWSKADGRIDIKLVDIREAGQALTLAIYYQGKPHVARRAPWDGGFVWAEAMTGRPWISTAVQGEGCDLFWPCFDTNLVEIDHVTTHIIVPAGLVAPGNGKFIAKDVLPDGRWRWNWHARSPNNYAIALDVAPYEELSATFDSRYGNNIPLHFWYLEGNHDQAEKLFAEWPDVIEFFETLIGPYPFGNEKLSAVETPHLGMEHQTKNAYGNGYKPEPRGFDWLFQHELSHEWFGNQLTNDDWDHMWLHEGFGAYMQPLYSRWKDGEMQYFSAMFKQRETIRNKFPLVSGSHKLEEDVYNPDYGPGGDIYVKGSWILHTLRNLIGDEAFFKATRRLVYGRADPVPGNFSPRFSNSDEFVAIVSEETGRDMGWFFDVYLKQAALPRLVTRRNGASLTLIWEAPGGIPFPMPVEILVDGKLEVIRMDDGSSVRTLPDVRSHVVIDPYSKILRQNDDIDRYRDWIEQQALKAAEQRKAAK